MVLKVKVRQSITEFIHLVDVLDRQLTDKTAAITESDEKEQSLAL